MVNRDKAQRPFKSTCLIVMFTICLGLIVSNGEINHRNKLMPRVK